MVACGPDKPGGDGGAGDDVVDASDPLVIDAPVGDDIDAFVPNVIDAGNVYPDANGSGGPDGGCVANSCPNPVPDGCMVGTTDVCGNGLDDNCNGMVDENCACQPGSVQSCFQNPPGYHDVGGCQDGQQTCQGSGEFTHWGPCQGGILPSPELCDSVDNDCNGCVDDDPLCCEVDLMCPSSMPDGVPFQDYVIDGTMFFGGAVTSWQWTVTGGPCDQLLAPNVSYTLNGTATTMVSGAALSTLTFRPTLSGDYTVRVVMTLPDGSTQECTFIVHIGGPGLRVELCWDTTGQSDVDLHLHRSGTTTPWFNTTPDPTATDLNSDDCHYGNCKANAHVCLLPPIICPTETADWGYADSPIGECSGSPEGAQWMMAGFCANPRLDIDNIVTVGKPENINVDKPLDNNSYRVAVHYYSGSVTTHPMVNVYCGGTLQATYGRAPDLVTTFGSGGPQHAEGPIWRVVDVTTHVTGGVTTGCDLAPINPPGMASGYYVTCPKPGSGANCADLDFN